MKHTARTVAVLLALGTLVGFVVAAGVTAQTDTQTVTPDQDERTPPDDRQYRFTVEPVNRTVPAGQETQFELRVTNAGEEQLRSIEGKIYVDSPLSSSEDRFFIDSLAPGETNTSSVTLLASNDTRQGSYPFIVDFQYERTGGVNEVSQAYNVSIDVVRFDRAAEAMGTAGSPQAPGEDSGDDAGADDSGDDGTRGGDGAGFTVTVVLLVVAGTTVLAVCEPDWL